MKDMTNNTKDPMAENLRTLIQHEVMDDCHPMLNVGTFTNCLDTFIELYSGSGLERAVRVFTLSYEINATLFQAFESKVESDDMTDDDWALCQSVGDVAIGMAYVLRSARRLLV